MDGTSQRHTGGSLRAQHRYKSQHFTRYKSQQVVGFHTSIHLYSQSHMVQSRQFRILRPSDDEDFPSIAGLSTKSNRRAMSSDDTGDVA